MAILVTGGAGYIGSHTAVALIEAGYEIVILDNLSNAEPDVLRRIEQISGGACPFVAADITHIAALRRVFAAHKIEAVIHFAGYKSVPGSVSDPIGYYQNNIAGSVNLLNVMDEFACRRLVFSSSATVYAGAGACPPFMENAPLGTLNPYGATKLIIEDMLRDLAKTGGGASGAGVWQFALLRYFNPAGAHTSGLIGDDPRGVPGNLVPYIQRVAAGLLPKLYVTGADFDTPDGTGVRDYIHVMDLARGHIAALEYLTRADGGVCEAFNLGTGRGLSVLEVVAAFEKACGKSIPYEIKPRRPGDAAVSYADVKKAREQLGFETRLTIEDMCRDAWRFACGGL